MAPGQGILLGPQTAQPTLAGHVACRGCHSSWQGHLLDQPDLDFCPDWDPWRKTTEQG